MGNCPLVERFWTYFDEVISFAYNLSSERSFFTVLFTDDKKRISCANTNWILTCRHTELPFKRLSKQKAWFALMNILVTLFVFYFSRNSGCTRLIEEVISYFILSHALSFAEKIWRPTHIISPGSDLYKKEQYLLNFSRISYNFFFEKFYHLWSRKVLLVYVKIEKWCYFSKISMHVST
jgi:hypothetical protein